MEPNLRVNSFKTLAILQVLLYSEVSGCKNFTILSDHLSVLESFEGKEIQPYKNVLVCKILKQINRLERKILFE